MLLKGKLPIDQDVYEELKSTGAFEVMSLAADEVYAVGRLAAHICLKCDSVAVLLLHCSAGSC